MHDSEDGTVGPDGDCVALKSTVGVVKDGLHAQQILIIWDAKWLLIMAKHLKVGWGCNEFKCVIYITTSIATV